MKLDEVLRRFFEIITQATIYFSKFRHLHCYFLLSDHLLTISSATRNLTNLTVPVSENISLFFKLSESHRAYILTLTALAGIVRPAWIQINKIMAVKFAFWVSPHFLVRPQ